MFYLCGNIKTMVDVSEFQFRGQAITGEFIYGDLFTIHDRAFIIPNESKRIGYDSEDKPICDFYEVLPKTVGMFTGILWHSGNWKIFSGKIRLEIRGLGIGDAEIVMYAGKWQIYNESQGYYPLNEAIDNQNILLHDID